MPSFCRHNRLLQNCPICAREQSVAMRPIVSSSAPASSPAAEPRPRGQGATNRSAARARPGSAPRSSAPGVRVVRLARGREDGFRSPLIPGVKSSTDAQRLAEEVAFSASRLARLAEDPPGCYRAIAHGEADIEERIWLAFECAYLCPLDDEDPFASIAQVTRSWGSGANPELEQVQTGPRTAHDSSRGAATLTAYRAWAARAGSQQAAITGELEWTAGRRFARVYERLALPGLHRDARYDFLVTLGALGVCELTAETLALGGANEVTVAAKRILGIGDPLLLARRASELAAACGFPLAALDLGFYNWGRGERATMGMGVHAEPDSGMVQAARAALGLE